MGPAQNFEHSQNPVHWRANFVAHIGQKLAFLPRGIQCRIAGLLDYFPRLVPNNGKPHRFADLLENLQALRVVLWIRIGVQEHHTQDFVTGGQRHNVVTMAGHVGETVFVSRVAEAILGNQHLARDRSPSAQTGSQRDVAFALEEFVAEIALMDKHFQPSPFDSTQKNAPI